MLTLILLAGALAADAFAVSICRGAGTSHKWRNAIGTGVVFGAVHVLMVALGWFVGDIIDAWKNYAPWIAAALLILLGSRMLIEARTGQLGEQRVQRPENPLLALAGLLSAAMATSVDGAAAGITLPLMGQPFWFAGLMIGGITILLSVLGYRAGALIGARWGNYATAAGGVTLIMIALNLIP